METFDIVFHHGGSFVHMPVDDYIGGILEARYKPLIFMLEDIRQATMTRMAKKKDLISKWTKNLTPKAVEKVEKAKEDHRFWRTTYNGDHEFEVKRGEDGYVVNLRDCNCSCRMWSLSGIPCAHAVSAIYYMKEDPYKYVSDCYKVDVCKAAYEHSIRGVDGQNLWPKTGFNPMLPPKARRMPGRPKKARRKGEQEKLDSVGKIRVTKKGGTLKCGICKGYGHNKKTCKSRSAEGSSVPVKRQQMKRKSNAGKGIDAESGKQTAKKRKNKEKIPDGYGIYISPETGNNFSRAPGSSLPVNLDGPSQQSQVLNDVSAPRRSPRKHATSTATVVTRNTTQKSRMHIRAAEAKKKMVKSGIYP